MIPKFRCFDKDTKTMHEVVSIDFRDWRVYYEAYGLRNYWNKNVVLMQSTGLHDKHGVEILEWDILTSQDGTDGLISRFIVKRDKFYTGFIPMNREGYGFNRTMCEVIGNVHQHHELLEDV